MHKNLCKGNQPWGRVKIVQMLTAINYIFFNVKILGDAMDCQRKQIMHNLKDPKGEKKRAPENWIS